MNYMVLVFTLIVPSLLSLHAWGEASQEGGAETHASSDSRLSPEVLQAYQRLDAIAKRHEEDLKQIPGVYSVNAGVGEIRVGIIIHSETREIDPGKLQSATATIPKTLEGVPVKIEAASLLPPPPGVIVLHPDGTREQAESCPRQYRERVSSTWRFCVPKNKSVGIPALMTPPIAGIPYEEALAIHKRHQSELFNLPGVTGVGLGAKGINVDTDKPDLLPKEVEGLPIIPKPQMIGRGLNHSEL